MASKIQATITTAPIASVISGAFSEFKKNSHIEPLFVFPTEIEKNSWIDWAVLNQGESGVEAVDCEQFIAWDDFKTAYIQSADETKNCIPALIRKIFAQRILENCDLKKLIPIAEINKNSVFAFTDWLSGILPSLALWKKHYDNDFKKNVADGKTEDDEENGDLLKIYNEYCGLLKKFNFYEPSYSETNFSSRNKKIYLFYPTILQDFSEFIDELASSSDVTFVVLPETTEMPTCINYPDARKELRRLALQIRNLIDGGVDLSRVAINVPNLENIRPYIERELRLYEIPFVVRNGIPYTRNCGGDIFGKIKNCVDENFSLDSVRNLLLDGFIPWKNEESNLKLVQAGVKQRIVCSSSEEKDIWILSFDGKIEFQSEKEYYEKLKGAVVAFKNAKSFRDLKIAWLEFSKEFIAEDEYKNNSEVYDLTDKILGRIITELSEFASLEEDFNEKYSSEKLYLNNYLDFFVNEIEQKAYTPNEKKYGVNILNYRVAACADFDYHFIINANQNDITVPLKSLSFITNEDKRKFLGLTHEDEKNRIIKLSDDGSAEFVKLYNAQYRNGNDAASKGFQKKVFWSSAKVNFDGAAITHTALKEVEDDSKSIASDALGGISLPASWQKSSFEKWAERTGLGEDEEGEFSESLKSKIKKTVLDENGFTKISASAMNSFYPCPKKWLFQNVMGIDDEKYSARLAEANEIGNLYHKVLELMFGELKGKRLPCYEEGDFEKVRAIVSKFLDSAIEKESTNSDLFKSTLSTNVLEKQKPIIESTLTRFVMQLCRRAENEDAPNGNYGGYKIEDTEKSLWFYDNNNKILFNGKIDLVLSCGTNSSGKLNAVIIDYKTGKMPTISESVVNGDFKIENFQMAMYVKLLENSTKAVDENGNKFEVQQGLFYSLKDTGGEFKCNYVIDTASGKGNAKKVSREDFKPTEEKFYEYASDFKNKIEVFDFSASGDYNAKNYVNPYSDCKKCRFKSTCRTTFNIGKLE